MRDRRVDLTPIEPPDRRELEERVVGAVMARVASSPPPLHVEVLEELGRWLIPVAAAIGLIAGTLLSRRPEPSHIGASATGAALGVPPSLAGWANTDRAPTTSELVVRFAGRSR